MKISMIMVILGLAVYLGIFALIIYFIFWINKALKTYVKSYEVRKDKSNIKKTLGQVLKENRLKCNMTQEFVAESLGVSRQAVSKWEMGISDPSTSNLLAIAKLYKIDVAQLMEQIKTEN